MKTQSADAISAKTLKELDAKLSGFMSWRITDNIEWFEIETNEGTIFVPSDEIGREDIKTDYACYEYTIIDGYGARLSDPGCLDCTEWAVFDTAQEAADYLLDAYADYDCEDEA
jgi:hypothetical protein